MPGNSIVIREQVLLILRYVQVTMIWLLHTTHIHSCYTTRHNTTQTIITFLLLGQYSHKYNHVQPTQTANYT